MEADEFFRNIASRAEYLSEKLIFGGVTKIGTIMVVTSSGMDLKTLVTIRKMISEEIKELKDRKATYMHEI